MPVNGRPEDEYFDDIEAEEALMEEREQAELDAADNEAEADPNDPAQILEATGW